MVFDLLLVIIFFLTFKWYDIYVATAVLMAGVFCQLMFYRLRHKRFDPKQLLICIVVMLFGGMTLYFHNPIFIKWKPSVIFWLIGGALFISQFLGKTPLIQLFMGEAILGKYNLPSTVWKRLNFAWSIFFILLGIINITIAYFLSTDAWVNFKLYGIFCALLLFSIGQSFYLAKHIPTSK